MSTRPEDRPSDAPRRKATAARALSTKSYVHTSTAVLEVHDRSDWRRRCCSWLHAACEIDFVMRARNEDVTAGHFLFLCLPATSRALPCVCTQQRTGASVHSRCGRPSPVGAERGVHGNGSRQRALAGPAARKASRWITFTSGDGLAVRSEALCGFEHQAHHSVRVTEW